MLNGIDHHVTLPEQTLEEALVRTSDSEIVSQLANLAWAKDPITGWLQSMRSNPHEKSYEDYWTIRNAAEAVFLARLKSGELYATGFEVPASPASTRESINPELWHVLKPDFETSSAEGAGLRVVHILVSASNPMSSQQRHGVEAAPFGRPWQRAFATEDFSVLRLENGVEFHFGLLQAAVIAKLHNAARTGNPWVVGKVALQDVGAETRSIGDLFRRHQDPDWRLLIDDQRGRYRLTVEITRANH